MNLKNVFTFSLFLLFFCLGFSTTIKAQEIDGATIVGQQLIATKHDFTEIIANGWAPTDSIIYFYNDQEQVIEKINLSYEETGWTQSTRSLVTHSEVDNHQIETFQWWRDGKWVNKSRIFLEMDGAGNVTRRQLQKYEWSKWKNVNLNLKTYNSKGQLLSTLWQTSFDGGPWTNRGRDQYEYDLQGNLIYQNYQQFIAWEWVNQRCNQYEFDLQGNLIYENSKQFVDGKWEIQKEDEYSYDAHQQLKLWITKYWEDGQIDEEIHCRHERDTIPNGFRVSEFFLENDIWVFAKQTTSLYNNQNHLILNKVQGLRSETWVNLSKDTFIYTTQNQEKIEQITNFQGDLAAWEPKRQASYAYNTQGQLTRIHQERWDGNNWYASTSGSYDFNYSPAGKLIKKTAYSARFNEGGSTGSLYIYFRNISYYNHSLSVSLDQLPKQPDFSLSIFPNPTQDYFYIHLNPIIGELSLKIFNATGQLVQTSTIHETLSFVPVTRFTKGVYFVHLTNGPQQIIRKIIIE